MYIKKYATADAVLAKKRDTENTTPGELRKVIAPLRRQKYKVIAKKPNDLLIRYCQWVYVENRERRVIA